MFAGSSTGVRRQDWYSQAAIVTSRRRNHPEGIRGGKELQYLYICINFSQFLAMTHTNVSPTSHTKNNESVLHHAVNSFMFRLPSLFPIHYFMNVNQKWPGLLLYFYLCIYDCTSTWVKRDCQPTRGSFYLSQARLSTHTRVLLPESSEIINPHADTST